MGDKVILEQGSPKDCYIPCRCFVFLSTWLVRWTWPKLL